MPRTSNKHVDVAATPLFPYYMPTGRHSNIVGAKALFDDLGDARLGWTAAIERGLKPRVNVTLQLPNFDLATVTHDVTILSKRVHVAPGLKFQAGAGRVTEYIGQIYLPDYGPAMTDVSMTYFANYEIGIMLPINRGMTISFMRILQNQAKMAARK